MARRPDHTCIDMALYDCKNCRNCKKCNKFKTCIFKVPKVLRRQNPEAYTPNVVFIGPYHRPKKESCGCEECQKRKECAKCKQFQDCTECKICIKCKEEEEEFQLTERVKVNYLNEFIRDTKTETFEKLMEKVIEHSNEGNTDQSTFEKRARAFYAKEGIADHISPEDLMKMMIVDGCFLVQLLRKRVDENLREEDDPVFDRDYMLTFLTHDILLLENQLPWFVLQSLYSLIINIGKKFRGQRCLSLPLLALDAFAKSPSLKHGCKAYSNHLVKSLNCHCDHNILHILDLIRSSIVIPSKLQFDFSQTNDEADIYDPDLHEMRTATALSKAGIRFKCVKEDETESILDIKFQKPQILRNGFLNGILNIPHFNVGNLTESLFRNLIAFEQCYPCYNNIITSYAIFMDNLISSQEDLELLCKAKVIGKWLSDEDGGEFFSDLYKGVSLRSFHYVDLCEELNKAYKMKGYTWVAAFKTEKLSNPWAVVAFVIGLVVLALTIWSNINNIRRFMRK